MYGSTVITPTVLHSSSDTEAQSGDWTQGISALRFVSNGKYVSGKPFRQCREIVVVLTVLCPSRSLDHKLTW